MIIKAGHLVTSLYSHDIILVLFVTSLYNHDIIWFYFSGLLNRIIYIKSLETGANLCVAVAAVLHILSCLLSHCCI